MGRRIGIPFLERDSRWELVRGEEMKERMGYVEQAVLFSFVCDADVSSRPLRYD